MNYHPACNFLRIFWYLAFLQIIINYSANSEKTRNCDVLIELICDSPSLLQWSCVQVRPNWGPLAVKLHFLQSNPTVHQHSIPLYLSLLICTRYFFLSPFQPLRRLPFLNIFLLPFFVSFPVWPQWVHTREMQIKSILCSQNGHILTSPCVL